MEEAIRKFLNNKPFHSINLKAVLFDMDGVIFDSMKYHASSWHETMRDFGIPFTPEEAYLHEGRTGKATIDILFERNFARKASPEEAEQLYLIKTQKFNECSKAEVMPGISSLLKKIKHTGLQPMVVTGSGQKSLIERLTMHFPGIFSPEYIITAEDVRNGKPNPEPYLKALEKGSYNPQEAIVIENAPLGIEAAHKAGIFTIAVNTGPLKDSILKDSGADFIFKDMPSLDTNWENIYSSLRNTKV
ncbi:MAG: HAD-IA family hydrolase [Candidatus Azobacteroides sp.]|nr:HAD-IA family hydrolase [Candidatus Azobacteroides sp.]